jgi:prepilin-type N-terminal cleavage/methylation domain-containing protein
MNAHPQLAGRRRGGFTLIEASLAMVIVGVAVVSMLQLMAAGSMSNARATDLTTAMNLSNNVREMCQRLPFAKNATVTWGMPANTTVATCTEVQHLDGLTLSGDNGTGPVDSGRAVIPNMRGWAQVISVKSVSATAVGTTLSTNSASTSPLVRVTVLILRNGQAAYTQSWLQSKGS